MFGDSRAHSWTWRCRGERQMIELGKVMLLVSLYQGSTKAFAISTANYQDE